MTRLAAALILCASAVSAEPAIQSMPQSNLWRSPIEPGLEAHYDPGPSDRWYMRIVITNIDGTGVHAMQVGRWGERVTMRYVSGTGRGVPDVVTVTDWPDGTIPEPMEIEIDENATGTIYMIRFMGG